MFSDWSIDTWIAFVSIAFIVIAGLFAFIQWRESNMIRQAEFMHKLTEMLKFNEEMGKTILLVEYESDWYNENFHNGNDDFEYKVDKLLTFLNYVCYLKKSRILRTREFKTMEYELYHVLASPAVQRYLWNVFHNASNYNSKSPFDYLTEYGLSKRILPISFTNKDSEEFKTYKYLNF